MWDPAAEMLNRLEDEPLPPPLSQGDQKPNTLHDSKQCVAHQHSTWLLTTVHVCGHGHARCVLPAKAVPASQMIHNCPQTAQIQHPLH
jgi:hypothetical protein